MTTDTPLPVCPNCRSPLEAGSFNSPWMERCPACSTPLNVEVFPALFRPIPRGEAGETILIEGESSCFYHPQKKAIVPCEACGRFLCALCDVELSGEHLCPGCLESGRKKGKITTLENRRTLYDGIALTIALLPAVLCFPISIITGPVAIFFALRYWNRPQSLVPRTKVRAVFAILVAVAAMVGAVAWFYFVPYQEWNQ